MRENLFLKIWKKEFSLSVLLLMIMITVFGFYPVAHKGIVQESLFFVFMCLSFMVGIFCVTTKLKGRIIATVFTLFMLLTYTSIKQRHNVAENEIMLSLIIAYLLILVAFLLKLIFSDNKPNVHRLQGAVAIYILYALIFSLIFRLDFLFNPEDIYFKNRTSGSDPIDPFEFMYFSFEILTTMGYGEIVPVGKIAQSLAMIEALSGVLFPSILIARIVSISDFFKKD